MRRLQTSAVKYSTNPSSQGSGVGSALVGTALFTVGVGGGVVGYAAFDDKFRKNLEESVPGTRVA